MFKQNFYVAPFLEEDIVGLTRLLGDERVIFGSDWPHPEGNVAPRDYAESLRGLPDSSVKKVMRDYALSLVS